MHNVTASANMNDFVSSLPVCVPLVSFSHLISLVSASSTILKRSGHSRHPNLALDFNRIVLSFSPFKTMLAMVLPYIIIIMSRCI